jgi:hypothetical protein
MDVRAAALSCFALAALPVTAAAADKRYEPIAAAYVDTAGKVVRSSGQSRVLAERPSRGNYCVLLQKDLHEDKWWDFLPALATPAEPGAELFIAASTGFRGVCSQYEKNDYRDGDWFAVHVTIKNREGAPVNQEFNILVP